MTIQVSRLFADSRLLPPAVEASLWKYSNGDGYFVKSGPRWVFSETYMSVIVLSRYEGV